MSVIVSDAGFAPEDWNFGFVALEALDGTDAASALAVDVHSDADAAELGERLGAIDLIRIDFPSSANGRGFTIARRLRAMGYQGRLRAAGHVLADQYAMARRVGFDEIEISDELAARQPEDQWRFRAEDWRDHDYQSRLRA